MQVRAAAAADTRRRILDACVDLLGTRFRSEIRLDDIAAGAAVTVQTVLNAFGSRAGVLDAALAELLRRLRAERLAAVPGDIDGCIAALVAHYERFGDHVIRNLAENGDPELLEIGRGGHRKWVRRQFAPQLRTIAASRRRLVLDQLVCATDVYVWKLLRRDLDRSAEHCAATMSATVQAVLAAAGQWRASSS